MRHRAQICEKYPDLFLNFIKGLELIREEKLTPQGKNIALLSSTSDVLVLGSQERSPNNLWAYVLEQTRHFTSDSEAPPERARTILSYFEDQSVALMDESKRSSLKKVEVNALRVPFDGAVAYTHSGIARPQNTLLFLISQVLAHYARVELSRFLW